MARSTARRPTCAAGAPEQRPMQGTGWTRTDPAFTAPRSASISARAPAISQDSPSQTRMVRGAGAASPSRTTSKWW